MFMSIEDNTMPIWWNGRHTGLEIRRFDKHEGSSPSIGTIRAPLFIEWGSFG